MAVPNTTTFALSDVVTELGLIPPKSLGDCFASASASSFDPSYEGSKDRLSNFRNYGSGVTTSAIFMTQTGQGTGNGACAQPSTFLRYISGGDVTPSNGDVIYTDASPSSSPFNGGNLFYSDTSLSFQVSTTGVVSNLNLCTI